MHVRRVTHLLWKNRCTTKMLKAKTMQNAKACVEMQLTKHSQNIMSSSSSSAAFSCPNIPLLYLGLNVCTAGAEGWKIPKREFHGTFTALPQHNNHIQFSNISQTSTWQPVKFQQLQSNFSMTITVQPNHDNHSQTLSELNMTSPVKPQHNSQTSTWQWQPNLNPTTTVEPQHDNDSQTSTWQPQPIKTVKTSTWQPQPNIKMTVKPPHDSHRQTSTWQIIIIMNT